MFSNKTKIFGWRRFQQGHFFSFLTLNEKTEKEQKNDKLFSAHDNCPTETFRSCFYEKNTQRQASIQTRFEAR